MKILTETLRMGISRDCFYSRYIECTDEKGTKEFRDALHLPDWVEQKKKDEHRAYAKALTKKVLDELVQLGQTGESFFQLKEEVICYDLTENHLEESWQKDNSDRSSRGLPQRDLGAYAMEEARNKWAWAWHRGCLISFPSDGDICCLVQLFSDSVIVYFYGNPSETTLSQLDTYMEDQGLLSESKADQKNKDLYWANQAAEASYKKENRDTSGLAGKSMQAIAYIIIIICAIFFWFSCSSNSHNYSSAWDDLPASEKKAFLDAKPYYDEIQRRKSMP